MSSSAAGKRARAAQGSGAGRAAAADPGKKPKAGGEPVLTVLVDMDGVLADFDARVCEVFRERYPDEKQVEMDSREHFYMSENFREQLGKSAGERAKAIPLQEGFFLALAPIAGALDALRAMDAHPRLNVMLCTSPLSTYTYVLFEKFAWVEKHLGKAWISKIVLTKDKTVVAGRCLIDDRPHVGGSVSVPAWEHVLFDQPYNRDVPGKRRLKGWANWRQLVDSLVAPASP